MKKVVLLNSLVGDGFCFPVGSIVDASDVEAERFIADGIARETSEEDLEVIESDRRFSLTSKGDDAPKSEPVKDVDPPPVPTEPAQKLVRKRRSKNAEMPDPS